MLEGILVILGTALLLYIVLAGADFGAGMLELVCPKDRYTAQQELTNRALGPVWEANHIWLIVVIVVLFIAFPVSFAELSTTFHVPLTVMLFGIILRGCSFTFRHYDPNPGDRTARMYSRLFAGSSVLSPLAQGLVAGGIISGARPPTGASFVEGYLAPWCTVFSWSIGLFLCTLYCMTAAIFFVGEATDPEVRSWCVRRARWTIASCIVMGGAVLLDPFANAGPIVEAFTGSWMSRIAIVAATADVAILALMVGSNQQAMVRILAGLVSACILTGWLGIEIEFIRSDGDHGILERLTSQTAPEVTLQFLFWTLVVATALIVPSLAYLFRIFKATPR